MDNDIQIQQPELKYHWLAIYKDGTELAQNYGLEDEHHYGHIDQEKLKIIALVNKRGERPHSLNLEDSTLNLNGVSLHVKLTQENKVRPIYFRRIAMTINGGEKPVVKHALGLQATENNKNYQLIALIGEDETIELLQKK